MPTLDDALDALPTAVVKPAVTALMAITARGMLAICRTDPAARGEAAGFPDGFTFEMKVLPSGPGFRARKIDGTFRLDHGSARPTLSIEFKHLRHALRVVTMIDDIPSAIANDRLVIDGELSWAMRVQRIMIKMMATLLPRELASASGALKLYARIATPRGLRGTP